MPSCIIVNSTVHTHVYLFILAENEFASHLGSRTWPPGLAWPVLVSYLCNRKNNAGKTQGLVGGVSLDSRCSRCSGEVLERGDYEQLLCSPGIDSGCPLLAEFKCSKASQLASKETKRNEHSPYHKPNNSTHNSHTHTPLIGQ